jgi:thiol peroxidase
MEASEMSAAERGRVVTMKGNPVTFLGPALNVGDVAPDFQVVDQAFQPVHLADFRGRPCLISAVPSLDTGVCALQTKRFNDEILQLPEDVAVLTISMDLPFAQKRFCEAEHVDRIRILSDHVWREFGTRYGLLIKDMGLLARSVFVISRDGRISYIEIVPEIGQHPDYDAALKAVRAAV